MSLRIGVNALYLIPGGVGGTEIYLRCLLEALATVDSKNRYIVFTNRETGAGLAPDAPNFTAEPQRVRASSRPARIVWEQTALAARTRGLDVLFNPGFTAPVFSACPQVTVFHDLQHKRHPEYFRWFDLPFWRLLLWAAARRSKLLIAVSDETQRDLLRFYRIPKDKVRVAPHGVDGACFPIAAARSPEPFLLCVSTLHPHTGLDTLLRAFAMYRRSRPEFRLVIAGHRGFHAGRLERLIAELDLGAAVTLTGWISRERLYELYRKAYAFVYPSTFEGFGMPVLEAMAAGVPTACASIEPLKTVAGNAAVLFEPSSIECLLAALERITSDEALRRRLAEAGSVRASQFSWETSARLTLAALQEAAA